jgi:hypothetical protein
MRRGSSKRDSGGLSRPTRLALTALAAAALAATAIASGSAATRAAAPVNGCPPTIEGTLVVGKTLGAGNGCWVNSPTSYSYKWLRCNNQTATSCAAISGATNQDYKLTDADVGRSLIVLVTATNAAGSTGPVNSKPSQLVSTAAPPIVKTQPTVTGKAQVGEALVAKAGTFTGGIPSKFAFQWQRCDKTGANCANISGATAESYGVRSTDVDHTLQVQVTASNDFGSVKATSAHTAVVQTIPQPVTVTTTITASRSVTTCCQAVRLSGTISTNKPGETVVILGREADALAAEPVAQTITGANGDWTTTLRPSVKTTYRAQAGTAPSAGVTINVRPRVGFGVNGRHWTVKVTGRDSFAGAMVMLQRRAGYRWVTIQRVVLNLNSVAHFTTNLHHGKWTVRAFVPSSETGPEYLSGVSHLQRIRA